LGVGVHAARAWRPPARARPARAGTTVDGLGYISGINDAVESCLHVVVKPDRRIVLLSILVLEVTLKCAAAERESLRSFVERFLFAFQRAGG
jgi:hypothetical protein